VFDTFLGLSFCSLSVPCVVMWKIVYRGFTYFTKCVFFFGGNVLLSHVNFKPNTFKKKVKVSIINIVFQLNNNNVLVVPLPLYMYICYIFSKLAAHNVRNFTNFVAMYLVYMAKSLKVPKFQTNLTLWQNHAIMCRVEHCQPKNMLQEASWGSV
jgi:hypothetical protein